MSNFTGREPPATVWPMYTPCSRAGVLAGDRHQRAELLDRQNVGVVAHRAAVRPRQMIQKQRRLQPQRPVQRDRPVPVHQQLHAALELRRVRRADRQRDRALQQRRALMRLQVRVELARQLPVLIGRKRQRAVRRSQLLPVGDVGVHDLAPHAADRLPVAGPARVQHRVDREIQRLQRREQQLRRARELRLLRQRPQRQHRLMRAALRRIHHQVAIVLGDRRVDVPDQVALQRLIRRPPVGRLHHQRRRLPMRIQRRLAQAAARRAAQQPLQLTRARPLHRHTRRRRGETRAPPQRSTPQAPRPGSAAARPPRAGPPAAGAPGPARAAAPVPTLVRGAARSDTAR